MGLGAKLKNFWTNVIRQQSTRSRWQRAKKRWSWGSTKKADGDSGRCKGSGVRKLRLDTQQDNAGHARTEMRDEVEDSGGTTASEGNGNDITGLPSYHAAVADSPPALPPLAYLDSWQYEAFLEEMRDLRMHGNFCARNHMGLVTMRQMEILHIMNMTR